MATTKQKDEEATSFFKGCLWGLVLLAVLTGGFFYVLSVLP